MGYTVGITGLESEESVTMFRLLVSEEALRSAEIIKDKAESNIIYLDTTEKKQRRYY